MPKYRTIEEKKKILLFIYSTKKAKDRVYEWTDEFLTNEKVMSRIYKYAPLWNYIDIVIGLKITPTVQCNLWNRVAEAIHFADKLPFA